MRLFQARSCFKLPSVALGALLVLVALGASACSAKSEEGGRTSESDSEIEGKGNANNADQAKGDDSDNGNSSEHPANDGIGGHSGQQDPSDPDGPARAGAGGSVSSDCFEGSKKCVETAAMICKNGAWTPAGSCDQSPPDVCADGTIPVNGDCSSKCPVGSKPIAAGETCPEGAVCFDLSSSERCRSDVYSPEECEKAGGTAVYDIGDGSLYRNGCPNGGVALGRIDPGGIEGALCCTAPSKDPCAAQDATFEGSCEPAPRYYWNGVGCDGRTGCSCKGDDCAAGFASSEDCVATFASCSGKLCGGFAGFTCAENEYCAYQPGQYCGAADASSICKERPQICTDDYTPVCGCDNKTYANACGANLAGMGILELGECSQQ